MRDEKTGEWIGYCIDLAKGIAEKMEFEYDIIVSEGFGRRKPPNGRWSGLTGDLVHGVRSSNLDTTLVLMESF
jgi:hypothetical protein